MSLKGISIKIEDRNGVVVFKNEVANTISLTSSGKVSLTLEELEEIIARFKDHFENTKK